MGNDPPKKVYKKVQFLAWEIYTGPIQRDLRTAVDYAGIMTPDKKKERRWAVLIQCIDIEARLEATKRALETALSQADPDENVLKVFVAPEFLYRGPAGAYLYDLINGWAAQAPFDDEDGSPLPAPFASGWSGLFGGLRALAADERFKDWIFVFGTAVSAIFTKEGDPATARNVSLIQRGGPGHEAERYCVEKHLKSWMDLVRFNLEHPGAAPFAFDQKDVEHESDKAAVILDGMMYDEKWDGGAVFRFPSVCRSDGQPLLFGVEICLDHYRAFEDRGGVNARRGRLITAGVRVDLQVVPSCGMALYEPSLSLAPETGPRDKSYAFNCDGHGKLHSRGLGAHVQLWHQVVNAGAYQKDPLLEMDIDEEGSGKTKHTAVPDDGIDLSGRVDRTDERLAELEDELELALNEIPTGMLWRSHDDGDPGADPHLVTWPGGLGYIRPLPAEPL